MGPLSTTIRMWGSKKFADIRGVVKENAGKYCVRLCYNKTRNVKTHNVTLRRARTTIVAMEKQ
jgi:hypothetical protein